MAFSQEDLQRFNTLFEELGMEPVDTEQDLRTWLQTHRDLKQETTEQETSDHEGDSAEDAEEAGARKVIEHHYRPKISSFGGTTKDCIPFDVWKYEVECCKQDKSFSRDEVLDSVRRSLKGDAAKVVMRLGPKVGLKEILQKLEGLYGQVASEGTLLTLFYATKQNEYEDVTAWSCRLEDMIQKVQDKGLIDRNTMYEMLRSKLWTGLSDDRLKQATRHKFDNLKDYNELIVAIRSVEQEYRSTSGEKKKVKTQVIQRTEETETQKMLSRIGDRLDRMEKDIKDLKDGGTSHMKEEFKASGRQTYRGRGGRRGNTRRWQDRRQKKEDGGSSMEASSQEDDKDQDVVCYRCGQVGHIALGCRVRTDHMKHLNKGSPLPGGGH